MSEQDIYKEIYASLCVDGKELYIGRALERAAHLWPERVVLIDPESEQRITFGELFCQSLGYCEYFRSSGIQKHDKVLIWSENSCAFYAAYYAVLQMGAIVVPINIFLHEKEVEHIARDAGAKAIIVSEKLYEKVEALVKTHENFPLIMRISELVALSSQHRSNHCFADNLVDRERDEPAVILYTSGTTGLPKGVMLSSHALITNALQVVTRFGNLPDDVIYCPLPPFHAYTQNVAVWGPILFGYATIIIPKIDRRTLLEALTYKPTVVVGIPAIFGLFCLMKNAPFSHVRIFVSGGDALPDKIRMYFEMLYGRKICNGYGLTETAPVIAFTFDDDIPATNTVGKPLVGIDIQLRDENGQVLGEDQVGILWVKGENLMLGYYNAPEATAAVMHNGWFNTGDLATYDTYGRLIICGREKDLIVQKGMKIYPQEVENILMMHPSVTAVAVIGLTIDHDETPVAYVVMRQESEKSVHELHELCVQNLANYKVPRQIILVKELPMTSTGKVNKKELKRRVSA